LREELKDKVITLYPTEMVYRIKQAAIFARQDGMNTADLGAEFDLSAFVAYASNWEAITPKLYSRRFRAAEPHLAEAVRATLRRDIRRVATLLLRAVGILDPGSIEKRLPIM
jgi:hypothetical protein